MFNDYYLGKTVLVTGHTGFKGSWLTLWLLRLGARVIGVSNSIPTTPSHFLELGLEKRITHYFCDVRNELQISAIIASERPDFVFHLAAQAIVSQSYVNPLETITTNAIGTAVVMDALRKAERPIAAVLITSDKAYENVEQIWGYREIDALGGKDVYSGSKGAAELIIKCFLHSFFTDPDGPVRVAVARAGNVIGGGDWASDRIVVDCVRAWSAGAKAEIRRPRATRPWQHVLEPLAGYLHLGAELANRPDLHREAFNFGPPAEQVYPVVELLEGLARIWGFEKPKDSYFVSGSAHYHEATLLKLNCDKALQRLQWRATLTYEETLAFTGQWYKKFYSDVAAAEDITAEQIEEYETLATSRGLVWTG